MDLLEGELEKILGTIRNWGRWSEIVAVRYPDNKSGEITFVNIVLISVFEWLVIVVICKMYGKKIFRQENLKTYWLNYDHYNSIG